MKNRQIKRLFLTVSILYGITVLSNITLAAGLTTLSDTMSRLHTSTASNHTIKFTTPTGAGDATDTITITLPAGFTIGSVDYTDIDLSYGVSTGYEVEATLAAVPGVSDWGASFTGQILTLTHPTDSNNGDIGPTFTVVVEIGTNASGGNAQLTNPASADTYTISIGGTFGDTGILAVAVVGEDQFTVTANVDPTLTFFLDTTSVNFGTLNTGVSTAVSGQTSNSYVRTLTSTNSVGGYSIRIRDQGNGSNPGLYNSVANFLIGSGDYTYGNSADLDIIAGYGIQATSPTATIAAPYNVTSNNVGGLELTDQNLANFNNLADNHVVDIILKARVTGSTPAGTYTDTITVVATANY